MHAQLLELDHCESGNSRTNIHQFWQSLFLEHQHRLQLQVCSKLSSNHQFIPQAVIGVHQGRLHQMPSHRGRSRRALMQHQVTSAVPRVRMLRPPMASWRRMGALRRPCTPFSGRIHVLCGTPPLDSFTRCASLAPRARDRLTSCCNNIGHELELLRTSHHHLSLLKAPVITSPTGRERSAPCLRVRSISSA